MIANSEDIKWLHVEASSKCNAWCPACPRNNQGFGLSPLLTEQDLTVDRFEQVLRTLPFLECVQFCGNYGDPIASAHFIELVLIAKKYVSKIQIHTNGSLRNASWWEELAQQLTDVEHDVWFGIDGLAGIHEIYRQGTDFSKIMQNATAFINHGGHATWQFIPYKHNEHQVLDCVKLSQKMQFKKFKIAKLYRKQIIARHYKTGETFDLLPTDSLKQIINIGRTEKIVDPKNCMHLSIPSVYLSASGKISRCCYMEIQEKFENVDTLLSNASDLTNKICTKNCG
jgi:hypothetical protein